MCLEYCTVMQMNSEYPNMDGSYNVKQKKSNTENCILYNSSHTNCFKGLKMDVY
jgi:hypothetical protein